MSQSNSGKSDPTPPDENAGKIKQNKDVKEEDVKRENDVRKKLSEITPPKRRKILHKMMMKYHNDPFYQPIDIAKKILKKLKVCNTQYFMGRIRQDMQKWIDENDPDSNSDEDNKIDSKKKVLEDIQKKRDILMAATSDEKAKAKINPEAVVEKAGLAEATKKLDPKEIEPKVQESPVSSKAVQKSSDSSSTVVRIEKEVPIIDLTIDLKMEIKKETITIDEGSLSTSFAKAPDNTTTSTPGNLPMMPYPMPGYHPNGYYYPEGYYPYYQNPYHDPNMHMYNPYMHPYDYQYPYNPYFYNPPYHSDYLPNYPVDHGSMQDPNLVNSAVDTQPSNISLTKNVDKLINTDAGRTEGAGELGKKQ